MEITASTIPPSQSCARYSSSSFSFMLEYFDENNSSLFALKATFLTSRPGTRVQGVANYHWTCSFRPLLSRCCVLLPDCTSSSECSTNLKSRITLLVKELPRLNLRQKHPTLEQALILPDTARRGNVPGTSSVAASVQSDLSKKQSEFFVKLKIVSRADFCEHRWKRIVLILDASARAGQKAQ